MDLVVGQERVISGLAIRHSPPVLLKGRYAGIGLSRSAKCFVHGLALEANLLTERETVSERRVFEACTDGSDRG